MDLMTYMPIALLLVLFIVGVPISFSLGVAGIVGIYVVTGNLNALLVLTGLTSFNSVAQYILTTIPMFILMALLASEGGLANDLFDVASNWLSKIRGGVAIATIFACGIFGAMSGVTSATGSVMSEIAVPNMRRIGYSDPIIGGVIAVGSTLDLLIPPSVAFVVYGLLTGTSIGQMLIAGVVPGILLGTILAAIILIWVTIRPQDAAMTYSVPWSKRLRGLARIWAPLLLIFMTMGLLYTGIATPTEIGGLGSFFAAVIGFSTRRLNWSGAIRALRQTLRVSAMIFFILIGGMLFGYYITQSGIPVMLINIVMALDVNRWWIMIAIIVSYFIFSMFMDEMPLMLIYLQLTFPLVVKLGFDPIWYGVVTGFMIMMGLVFPPVGVLAFIVSGVGKIEITDVFKGTVILTSALIITTVAICIWPEIVTWLPSTMRMK